MPRIIRHVLLILVPVVGAFAMLPSIYSNHLLLFNFMIFIMLAQGVNVIYGFTGSCHSVTWGFLVPVPTDSR